MQFVAIVIWLYPMTLCLKVSPVLFNVLINTRSLLANIVFSCHTSPSDNSLILYSTTVYYVTEIESKGEGR